MGDDTTIQIQLHVEGEFVEVGGESQPDIHATSHVRQPDIGDVSPRVVD